LCSKEDCQHLISFQLDFKNKKDVVLFRWCQVVLMPKTCSSATNLNKSTTSSCICPWGTTQLQKAPHCIRNWGLHLLALTGRNVSKFRAAPRTRARFSTCCAKKKEGRGQGQGRWQRWARKWQRRRGGDEEKASVDEANEHFVMSNCFNLIPQFQPFWPHGSTSNSLFLCLGSFCCPSAPKTAFEAQLHLLQWLTFVWKAAPQTDLTAVIFACWIQTWVFSFFFSFDLETVSLQQELRIFLTCNLCFSLPALGQLIPDGHHSCLHLLVVLVVVTSPKFQTMFAVEAMLFRHVQWHLLQGMGTCTLGIPNCGQPLLTHFVCPWDYF